MQTPPLDTRPLYRNEVRDIDRVAIEEFGIPGIVLMENAARGCADSIDRLAPPGPIAILCGKGNNGGDGYAIARHLELAGRRVTIVAVASPSEMSGDAKINATIAARAEIPIVMASANIAPGHVAIIDALLGTGATGPPRGVYADLVRAANNADAMRISIDIPTGLDCDTGVASEPTFRADHTLTFVAKKVGFQQKGADQLTGSLEIISIGIPAKQIADLHRQLGP